LDIDDATTQSEDLKMVNTELWRAQQYSDYEPDTIAWIDENFATGDVIYDIGANIGQYGLYAAKSLQGRCQVLAFEPEALNYAKLNKNIVLNQLSDTVMPYCLALTGSTTLDTLYVHSFIPGAAFHSFGRSVKQGDVPFSPAHIQGMVGFSLDDITGRFALPFPNHIKIDVDGAEVFVISGASKTLADTRLRTVMIEIYLDEERTAASTIMDAFSAASFVLENSSVIEEETGTAPNFIFTRSGTAA
jgi:FkbM family methyltransferase